VLFDLRGRRRRAVQATYLLLAVLLGGGLVLFGIGGEVSGGLFNAFSDGSGGGNGNSVIQDRIEKQEERLAAQPDNEALLQSLVRDYYGLATSQQQSGSTEFPDDAKDDLRKAAGYWERYVDTVSENPSPNTALFALRVYDVGALNRPGEAQKAAAIIARKQNDSASYLQLVSYAALAKDTRTADLAAQKAIDLAPKGQEKEVKQQAELLKKPPEQQQQQQVPQG
jgi:hypothetical protein